MQEVMSDKNWLINFSFHICLPSIKVSTCVLLSRAENPMGFKPGDECAKSLARKQRLLSRCALLKVYQSIYSITPQTIDTVKIDSHYSLYNKYFIGAGEYDKMIRYNENPREPHKIILETEKSYNNFIKNSKS